MSSELVLAYSRISASFDKNWARLGLSLSFEHDYVYLIVIKVIVVNLDTLPWPKELIIEVLNCSCKFGWNTAKGPASIQFMAVKEVNGTLNLRHVNFIAIPVAPIEPGRLVFTIT